MERTNTRPSVIDNSNRSTVDKLSRVDTLNWPLGASGRADAGTIGFQDGDGQDPLLALLRENASRPRSKEETQLPEAEMYTKPQAAALMNVSVRSVDRLVARGEIPHVRLGKRCVRFPLKALRAWLESKTRFRR